MSTPPTSISPSSSPYRRRIGRAASPPTWACYEQIRDYGESEDDSEDESESDEDEGGHSDGEGEGHGGDAEVVVAPGHDDEGMAADMDIDPDAEGQAHAADAHDGAEPGPPPTPTPKAKGKQRAVEPEPVPKRRTRKGKRERVYQLRPILTIQRSQGFVWNQDLFVPPYIKDRYVASTSPPGSGFMSTSVSSTNSVLTDYEVEVVEIRVQEGEFDGIIP
ncbi:hypothetical protein HMN09_00461900 [Mycena chlorophos]|uniref:Uncharacterized protein n=1 Tax=Mycena chlorophos TaxID=658473 RepID=A0A8H6WGY3_MYCCL|nr:hypothetical protein HMN09_00461900 [Mycena chlorophos]